MKEAVIVAILEKLKSEREVLAGAVQNAHEAAIHVESKAEDQYDTRGLEASYLAAGQAKRVTELDRMMVMFEAMLDGARKTDPKVIAKLPIGFGALIELELDGKRGFYFLVKEGGGITVKVDGKSVQVITPQSPLGEALEGEKKGGSVEIEVQGASREYDILSVS